MISTAILTTDTRIARVLFLGFPEPEVHDKQHPDTEGAPDAGIS